MNSYVEERLPIFVFVLVIFVLGIAFGAIAVKTVEYGMRESIFNYFNNFIKGFNDLNYNSGQLVGESIKFNLLNMLIISFFGITVILMPLITVLIFFKGFVLGFTVGFLVSEYGYGGILIALATVFPQNLLIIPGFLMISVTAIYISFRIFKYLRKVERLIPEDFLNYFFEMGIFGVALLGGAVLETYISPLLFRIIVKILHLTN